MRGINTQGVLERIKILGKLHQPSIIAISEPFSDKNQVQNFKVHLAMDQATSNCNDKIWDQFSITFVYAKCKDFLRRPLWDRMLHQASGNNRPWCSVGDYNVITNIEEKLGGVPYNMKKSLDFIATIEACGLIDLGFSGQKFTWSNKRGIGHRIWKRLDRALVNDTWLEKMP
ncbi:hypothetical protein R3W88_034129 [Solanum pinnatisectum]|uniref:Uncharacterized protein n=1 Tax=Solanum pinnatisectum TaxID=50273 RepID=A0AAV9K0N6_9SOLN|nr:hypothetical protein R3W88_034129 [Solanum pinnatisectum]